MKSIPSFSEFSKYYDFVEPVDESLLFEFSNLPRVENPVLLNESSILNQVKNSISKFFLGSFSRLNMLDEARQVILSLKLDLLEKKFGLEKKIDAITDEIEELKKSSADQQKISELTKKQKLLTDEFEKYETAQELKIKKSVDVANKLVDKNPRRREYLEAGLADDEITFAEREYELARKMIKYQSDLSRMRKEIEEKKLEAKEKAEDLKDQTKDDFETGNKNPNDFAVNPEEEKKKIIGKKPQDIIDYKNTLQKEIADLKTKLERKIEYLRKKMRVNPQGILAPTLSQEHLEELKIEMINLTEELDCKQNILQRIKSLGKTDDQIEKSMDSQSELSKLTRMINQDIKDGQDEKTGTKKIVSDLFVDKSGQITVTQDGISRAQKKLNE